MVSILMIINVFLICYSYIISYFSIVFLSNLTIYLQSD